MYVDKEMLELINEILLELENSPDPQVIDFTESFPELEKCIDCLQKKLYD